MGEITIKKEPLPEKPKREIKKESDILASRPLKAQRKPTSTKPQVAQAKVEEERPKDIPSKPKQIVFRKTNDLTITEILDLEKVEMT